MKDSKTYKLRKNKHKIIFLGMITLFTAIAFIYQEVRSLQVSEPVSYYYLPVINTYLAQAKEAKIQQFAAEDRQYRIDLIENLFARYNSPMKGLGGIIYDRAQECGGDYKIIVGIAGNESGFGRVPYKLYNPFGYLDGVQYSSFEDAVYNITCSISKRFIAPCKGDLSCIVRSYGGADTPKQQWIGNVSWFMSQL